MNFIADTFPFFVNRSCQDAWALAVSPQYSQDFTFNILVVKRVPSN
jgi:hypothetical protein